MGVWPTAVCGGRPHPQRALRPLHTQLPQRCQLVRGELVAPRFGVRDPHAQFHSHRLRLTVDRDLFAVAPWHGPLALPFDPLREGRQAALERLRRLARALRRALGGRGGRRCLSGCDAQLGQPLLLLGQEPRPDGRLSLLLVWRS